MVNVWDTETPTDASTTSPLTSFYCGVGHFCNAATDRSQRGSCVCLCVYMCCKQVVTGGMVMMLVMMLTVMMAIIMVVIMEMMVVMPITLCCTNQ